MPQAWRNVWSETLRLRASTTKTRRSPAGIFIFILYNEEFLAEFPNATQRTTEQSDFIKSIKNRINRLKHRIADNTMFDKKQKKSGKERIKEYREKLSNSEKKAARDAAKEGMKELREKQSDSEKKAARVSDAKRKMESREKQSDSERKAARVADAKRKRESREKQSNSEKNDARDAPAERMKRLRAKQASQQTVDAVVDQHDEAFRYLSFSHK